MAVNKNIVPYEKQKKASFFKSTDPQFTSMSTLTPQQQSYINQLSGVIPQGISNLNLPGQTSNFKPIAQEARRNFSQNTLPTLAERFAGLGRNSSGLQQALGGAASDFESQLAAQQAQYGLQEQGLQSNNLMNLLSASLTPQFDYGLIPGQDSGIRKIWNSVKSPLAQAGLNFATGGFGGSALSALQGLGNRSSQQGQLSAGGTGAGANSFGFGGQKSTPFQPVQNQLSTQRLAGAGYPQLNDVFNQGQYKF